MNIDEFENVCKYLDEYGVLLTDKQYSIMTDYYFNNLSLSEIGINLGISRQAVASAIKQSMAQLREYDKQLNLKNNQKNTGGISRKDVPPELFPGFAAQLILLRIIFIIFSYMA